MLKAKEKSGKFSPNKTKWQRRPDNRPDEIADAAIRIFSRKGFDNSTMDEIADAAGVSKGTVYLYYKSKEDLLVSSIETRLKKIRGQILSILQNSPVINPLPGSEVKKTLAEMLDGMISIISDSESRQMIRLLLSERGKSERLRKMHSSVTVSILKAIAEFLNHAKKSGAIECENPDKIAKALYGMVLIFTLADDLLGLKPQAFENKSTRKTVIDFALRGLGIRSNEGVMKNA
ncbi:MAG: TetR/AcrR family transcriptional regulator [bacterium]